MQFIPCFKSRSHITLHKLSWNLTLLLHLLNPVYSICHEKIGKVPVSRIDAIWNKGRYVTCLNATTGNATAAKQATIVVHGLTPHLAHMEPHILNIELIDAVLDIYPEENILKTLTYQRRGNDPLTSVGDGIIPITKSDWNSGFLNNEVKKADIFKICEYSCI